MTATNSLDLLTWPYSQLREAISALAEENGLLINSGAGTVKPPTEADLLVDQQAVNWQIETIARQIGVEAEPRLIHYGEVVSLIRTTNPILIQLRIKGEPRFLLLPGRRGPKIRILGPDGVTHSLPVEVIRQELVREIEAPYALETEQLLNLAQSSNARLSRAKLAILSERLSLLEIAQGWELRLAPNVSIWRQAKHTKLIHYLPALAAIHALAYGLYVLSWTVIGRSIFQGYFDSGWLIAWALLLLTTIPLRIVELWWQSIFNVKAGAMLKKRLLYGVLRLKPDEIRPQGIGQLLGRVHESGILETQSLEGTVVVLIGIVELVIGGLVLAAGAGGLFHVFLLSGWILLIGILSWELYKRRVQWTDMRRTITHDLVERLVGYRTRLAQESPDRWHDEEDESIKTYLYLTRQSDQINSYLSLYLTRGWIAVGLLGLLVPIISRTSSLELLTVGLGGIFLVDQAIKDLIPGIFSLTQAIVAWRQLTPLLSAAIQPEENGSLTIAPTPERSAGDQILVTARNLGFRYRDHQPSILKGCNLTIVNGDRLLLEGPSGGGKSTLASLLIGLRKPQSGLLLLNGLDRQTLGEMAWRRHVIAAPQFHENHIISDTFAFNLLMGRCWPPRAEDLELAETICQELGLGDLLTRMPAGMLQIVGDTGWQLSHGERSRLFVARALLQDVNMVVLDESFAALDAENLQCALQCCLNRAKTLLVIAHP
jgi:ATP-binding cassette subfamily B protein